MASKKNTKVYAKVTPHGPIQKVSENVFCVEGTVYVAPLARISRTMTIVRRGSDLTIINSCRVNKEVEKEILKLGTIKHLVRLSGNHGLDDRYYKDTFHPTFWDLPENVPPKGIIAADTFISEKGDDKPMDDCEFIIFKITAVPESQMWIPDASGTLITTDSIQNGISCKVERQSIMGRAAKSVMGFNTGCCTTPKLWRESLMYNGKELYYPNFERTLELEFENLISGHGPAKVGGAKKEVKTALGRIKPAKGWKEDQL